MSNATVKHADSGTCWVIEKTGTRRQVFGPYGSITEAAKHAGIRYAVIRGSGLSNGKTYSDGEFHACVDAKSFYSVDGSDLR